MERDERLQNPFFQILYLLVFIWQDREVEDILQKSVKNGSWDQ